MVEMSLFIPISLLLLPLTLLVRKKILFGRIVISVPSLLATSVLLFIAIILFVEGGVITLLYLLFTYFFVWSFFIALSVHREILFGMVAIVMVAIPIFLVVGAERTAERTASILFVLLVIIVLRDALNTRVLESN